MSAPEPSELLHFLNGYAEAWARNDASAIAAHWDPDRFLLYKAEEVQRVFDDWNDALAYWRNNEGLHERISLRFSDPAVHGGGDDIVVASVRMRWDIRFATDARLPDGAAFAHRGQAMGGDNHVMVLLGRSGAGWRLRGWSETPDAPITYIRELYLANADTDLV